ncbi:hypothetical protein PHISP_02294 [Aspergillus sp. HF37]|nr:hypothetical protein PHISP_02294 [Aspergillus sp. HF37]
MSIWSGSIALNEESRLEAPNGQSDISKDAILLFRCFVNPALIPLYARTGPNLQVHAINAESSEWLKNKFLASIWPEGEELDNLKSLQCPVGLLIGVDGPARTPSGAATSDLLVYGIVSCTPSFERPPTPPVSSSSGNYDNISPVKRELRIYAVPLAASLIAKAQSLPTPPRSPADSTGDAQFAEFLPDFRSPSPKRKRVATLFESVAQHHKRVRQKGGEAVSQMASSQMHAPGIKRESEEPSLFGGAQRSKSVSGNINPWRHSDLRAGPSRPSSARDLHSMSRRGTPIEISTQRISSPALPSSEGKHDSSLPKDAGTVVLDNKNVITRTILTCMRLYGFNRPRPASGKHGTDLDGPLEKESYTPAPEVPSTAPASTEEDDFKSMYHATYRASTFALRRYLREPPDRTCPPLLDRGKAMGYIDEFLRLFCEEGGGPGTD